MKRIALSTVALASILSLVGCSTGTTSTAPNNTVNRPSSPPGQSNSVSSAENDTGNTDRGSTNTDSGSTVGMGNQNPTTVGAKCTSEDVADIQLSDHCSNGNEPPPE